jgi:hypothetical protein
LRLQDDGGLAVWGVARRIHLLKLRQNCGWAT